ncbi:Ionotropic receptor 586 [Blattella germanica]|nr:Ionotropic receptor 586 [Blattella germanica]
MNIPAEHSKEVILCMNNIIGAALEQVLSPIVVLPEDNQSQTISTILHGRIQVIPHMMTTRDTFCSTQLTGSSRDIYIIFIDSSTNTEESLHQLTNQMKCLSNKSIISSKSRFVITILGHHSTTERVLRLIFQYFYKFNVLNIIVVVRQYLNSDVFGIYTWFPYRHFGKCDLVDDVTLLTECPKQQVLLHSHLFPYKIPNNLKGCPLRAQTCQFPPVTGKVILTKGTDATNDVIDYEDGWDIRLLRIIIQSMGATLKFIQPIPNTSLSNIQKIGIWTVINAYLETKEADIAIGGLPISHLVTENIDMTIPFELSPQFWWVPCPSELHRGLSLLRIFQPIVWLFFFFALISAALILQILGNITESSRIYKSFSTCLLNIWAMVVGVVQNSVPGSNTVRAFLLSWMCYSFVVNNILQSYLTSFFTNPGMEKPLTSVEEILDSGLGIGYAGKLGSFLKDDDESVSKRILQGQPYLINKNILDRIGFKKNYAILEGEKMMQYYRNKLYIKENGDHLICSVRDVYKYFMYGIGLQRTSPFLDRVNIILRRILEAGLLNQWYEETNHGLRIAAAHRANESEEKELQQMQSAFVLMCLGHSLAFAFLLLELLYKRLIRKGIQNLRN